MKMSLTWGALYGRYCFRMDEILDPETVSSVSAFGETFSIE